MGYAPWVKADAWVADDFGGGLWILVVMKSAIFYGFPLTIYVCRARSAIVSATWPRRMRVAHAG